MRYDADMPTVPAEDTLPHTAPAFPSAVSTRGFNPGMSLRDYFAAQALAGFCSNPSNTDSQTTMADRAYKHADAMLKAREGK